VDPAAVEIIICDKRLPGATRVEFERLRAAYPSLRDRPAGKNHGFSAAAKPRSPAGLAAKPRGAPSTTDAIGTSAAVGNAHRRARAPSRGRWWSPAVCSARDPTVSAHAPAANPHLEADVSLSEHHANVVPAAARPDQLIELDSAPFFCVLQTAPRSTPIGPLDERSRRHYRSDSILLRGGARGRRPAHPLHPAGQVYHLLQQSTHALRDGNHEEFRSLYEANRLAGDRPRPWD